MKLLLITSVILAVLSLGGNKDAHSTPGAPQSSGARVCGTLVGADGTPMIKATVTVSRPVLPGTGLIKEEERLLGMQNLTNSGSFLRVLVGFRPCAGAGVRGQPQPG